MSIEKKIQMLSEITAFETFGSGYFYELIIPLLKENVGTKKSQFFVKNDNKWCAVEKIAFLTKISRIILEKINNYLDYLNEYRDNTICEDTKNHMDIKRSKLCKKIEYIKNLNNIKKLIKDINLTIEDIGDTAETKNIPDGKTSDAILRTQVWSYYIGNHYNVKCPCCKVNIISPQNFECGHVIAKSKGGETTLKNLRPICNICNKSLGTREIDLDKYVVIIDGKIVDNSLNQKDIDPGDIKKKENINIPKLKICNSIEQKIEDKMDQIFLEFNTTENITSRDFYKLVEKLTLTKLKDQP